MKTKTLLLTILTILSIHLQGAVNIYTSHTDEGLRVETNVYPNPSTGIFKLNIESDSYTTFHVKVMNLIGQPVAEKLVAANYETTFDLSAQPKGVYFLSVDVGQRHIIKRLIIQ